MKTHKSVIAEVLNYFGPLSAPQITEKLNLRAEDKRYCLSLHQVEAALYSWNPDLIVQASGYDVPTYRITCPDAIRRLEY